jgi:hypothetical protein
MEPTCLSLLANLIAARGYVRASSETIEAFATRIRQSTENTEFARAAGQLLEDYARLRYGGIGDMNELEQRIRALKDTHVSM